MTHLVFLIPEVLSEILEQVNYSDRETHWWWPVPRRRPRGPRTLTRCLLVNKLWFNEASRILWREGASLRYLASIDVDDKERWQHYAKMIKQLTVPSVYEAYTRFRFSGLESLSIIQHPSLRWLEKELGLLVPTLKDVTIDRPSIESIEKLQRECPLVESLDLDIDKLDSEEDLERLKRCFMAFRAARVTLSGRYTDVLLSSLARNECVRELIGVEINQAAVLSVREEGGLQPFKNLRFLSCGVCYLVRARDVLNIMPNLESVKTGRSCCDHAPVHVETCLDDVLQFASVRLKRVCMAAGYSHVKKSLLLALANKFRQLESIQLYSWTPDSETHDSSEDLDDEFAHEFTKCLPNLRVIELEFHGSLSAEGLIGIGKNCQHLELLDLYGYWPFTGCWPLRLRKQVLFNYQRFCMEKEPLFPQLICLSPTERLKPFPSSMQEYHFPKIFAQWEHSHSVVEKYDLRMQWRRQGLHCK